MALPTKLVSWNYDLQNRIVYASLVQVMRETIYEVKQRLVADGWTVKGSSDGTTGGMDGVDRWVTATNAGTRANSSTLPISWIVLTDANSYNICFSYNSATDDVYRISVSFLNNYVAAATATHQPTSVTEQTLNTFYTSTPGTIIGSTASSDRLVSIWTRPDAKGFRIAIARAGAWTSLFGVDMHDPVAYASGITVSLAHGFYVNGGYTSWASSSGLCANNTAGSAATAQFRTVARRLDAGLSLDCAHTLEMTRDVAGTASNMSADEGMTFAPELQGGTEYMLKRKGLFSITAGGRGKVGNNLDWWCGRTAISDGDTYGNREFVVVDGTNGFVWPWDGTPSVTGTAVVMT